MNFFGFNFSEKHPFVQLLILCFLMLIGVLFSFLFSNAVGIVVFGPNVLTNNIMNEHLLSSHQIAFLKFSQICSLLGALLFPALFFAKFQEVKTFDYLRMKKFGGGVALIITIIVMFAISPFIAMLQEWNASLSFPESMQKIENFARQMEEQAQKMTQIFLETHSVGGLLLNIGIMAVLPAFSEELFFRGAMQQVFYKWTKNHVWAIVVTAIIFSGFHFQFYGFFPRFILGVVLGTLYVISGSLWMPIIAHFVNNATVVIIEYLALNNKISVTAEEFGQTDHPFWIILSVCVVLALFWILKKYHKKNYTHLS